MNSTVTASGMQVSAKSSSVDLLIDQASSLTTIQEHNNTSTAFTTTAAESKLYPAAYFKSSDTTPAGSAAVTNADTAAAVKNWYYKIADKADSSASGTSPSVLTAFTDYVIVYDVYVTMAQGSNSATNLVVSSSSFVTNAASETTEATRSAVRALVVSDNAVVELSPSQTSSSTVLAAEVTDEAVIHLAVYVFYDGNDSTVYTNNIANLDGAKISINFSVTPTT